jgi:hypothetical protein
MSFIYDIRHNDVSSSEYVVSIGRMILTDGVSTLSWWLGLSTPETLRDMPAVE